MQMNLAVNFSADSQLLKTVIGSSLREAFSARWEPSRRAVLLVGVVLLVSVCANTPSAHAASNVPQKTAASANELNLPLSKQGAPEYSLFIRRDVGRWYAENTLDRIDHLGADQNVILGQTPNNSSSQVAPADYERIHVYRSGVYPDFVPDSPSQPQNTMFGDDTFQDLMAIAAIRDNTVFKTSFDEKKFLAIANKVVAWYESTIPLALSLNAQDVVSEEFMDVSIAIESSPANAMGDLQFYVDESRVQASQLPGASPGRIKQNRRYRIGVPTGKHRIKVVMVAADGASTESWLSVVNTFAGQPTLHLVAIGINEFPNWGASATLAGAVNDANLVKKIFQDKASDLFGGRISISPYSLGPDQTTKQNITNLIETVKSKVRPNDYFVLFVSSHGLIYGDKFYFAPSDIGFALDYTDNSGNTQSKLVNGFGEDQISDYLITIPTIFRMAILDTCHAGKEVDGIKQLLNALPLGEQTGVSVLTAAKSTQAARDNYKGYGLFTYVLADGLTGAADYNGDNIVDSIEIAQYVRMNVGRVSRSNSSFAQDAVVLPDPTVHFTRRFELTRIDPKPAYTLQPSVFTPRESQLYINAISQQDSSLMTGVIQNNHRHNQAGARPSLTAVPTSEEMAAFLSRYGSVDISIAFGNDSADVDSSELEKLRMLAIALNGPRISGKRIFIEGHADGTGDKQYNLGLSQRRADHVLEMLSQRFGVSQQRMKSLGFGELYPVAGNDTEGGRAKNRRVSVFVYNES